MRIGAALTLSFAIGIAAACASPQYLARDVNPGCEKVALLEPGATVAPHVVLKELHGKSKEEAKNMSNWLQNKACALGADAVIDVVKSEGTDGKQTIYNIHGVAVRFTDGSEATEAEASAPN